MNSAESNPTSRTKARGPGRSTLLLTAMAVASVLLPYTVWRQTWFGAPLSDNEIAKYLHSEDRPRQIQHALSRIAERMAGGDQTAGQWYPEIVRLAEDPRPEIRNTVAWAMGQDNRSEEFRQALLRLLQDSDPTVRWNAALSLIRFGDPSGRSELVSLLEGEVVRSPAAGTVSILVAEGSEINARTLLARIEQPNGSSAEVRSPIAGSVETVYQPTGSRVAGGDKLILVRPDSSQVWEALRGLYLIGRPEDLPVVGRYESSLPDMPARIREQAELTLEAIRARADN